MCFSASASFIASGGLGALGGASLKVAKKRDKILAAIPLLFAVQQFLEGIQWLYLKAGSVSLFAGYGFLVFAFIIWPIYVPIFVYLLDKRRKKFLQWFIYLGIAVALYFLWLMIREPLMIEEMRNCISYNFNFPFRVIISSAYVIAILGPLFGSSHKSFRRFGIVVAILALIAWIFYVDVFISVWCFFAAVVSCIFFVYIKYNIPNSRQDQNGLL
jgi:hypothetical protein